jgi:phosphatidylethanolamine-binding protein (PEBP) family uncharacterized protein
MLEVFYKHIKVNNNQYLKPSDASSKPDINYEGNPNKLYTLIVHDPDAPVGNVVHWVIINIKGSDINTGKEIIKYKGPAPPSGSGTHHYIFLIFEQTTKIQHNIITNNVIPMDKLLSQLGLQNTQPIYTIQFTSSYTKGGKKQIRKTKKMNKSNKSKRIIKKRIKKTRRNLKY